MNVKVVSGGQSLGRVIPITENHPGTLPTVFVATNDCARIDEFVTVSGGPASVVLYPSIDGTTVSIASPYPVYVPATGGWNQTLFATNNPVAAATGFGTEGYGNSAISNPVTSSPFVGVEVPSATGSESVSLYCRYTAS